LRGGESAAGGLEESQRADCQKGSRTMDWRPLWDPAESAENGVLHNSNPSRKNRASVSPFFSVDFFGIVAVRARPLVSIVFQQYFQRNKIEPQIDKKSTLSSILLLVQNTPIHPKPNPCLFESN
jgi:hypothetical protein